MKRFLCWLLKLRVERLESGKSYVLFYTPQSGLSRPDLRVFGSGLHDCTVFLQPILKLDEIKFVEVPRER